uniref:Mitochondrial carrier protein n=1 Tax=Arcella intermedia TaxID=1963864 RepID=A0A6B2LCU8_9EUKA
MAGASAAVFTCPFDVLKTRLQVQSPTQMQYKMGLIDMVKKIYRVEGFRGFFTGLSPTLLGLVPTYAIYFTTYTNCKYYYINQGLREGAFLHLLSAVSAGVFTDVCTNPMWVIKTRLQTQILRPDLVPYRGITNCFHRMIKEEGFTSLYKGLLPQLMGLVHVGVQFPIYERLKIEMMKRNTENQHLAISQLMFAAVCSKCIAVVTAYPHEVIRSNLQFQHTGEPGTGGFRFIVRKIYSLEGAKGFYRGLTPNLLKVLPSTAICFTAYELLNSYFSKMQHE